MVYLLIIIVPVLCHIYTWDFEMQYNIDGILDEITIPASFDNPVPVNAFIHIGGVQLHVNALSEVTLTIINLANKQMLLSAQPSSLTTQTAFPLHYYFQMSQKIPSNQMLQLQLSVTKQLSGLYSDPLLIRSLASLQDQAIIYDYNYAAGLLYVTAEPPSTLGITSVVDTNTYSNYQQPGAQYVINITLTPRVSVSKAQILIQIVKDSQTSGLAIDFAFVTSCSMANCACTLTTAQLSITCSSITQNTQYTVTTGVSNPQFVSIRDLKVATISSGYFVEKSSRTNFFTVNPISTQTTNILYLWGISSTETLTDSAVSIFLAQSASYNTPYNGIQFQFTVSASVNLLFPMVVQALVGCTNDAVNCPLINALPGTIKHNLPPFSANGTVLCTFNVQYLQCSNVGVLLSTVTYFISGRVYYPPGISNLLQFGQISFYMLAGSIQLQIYQSSTGTQTPTLTKDVHMLDIGGWHGPSGYLSYTQVSSIQGNTLQAADVLKILGPTATVGIMPSANQQSLVFFLKSTQQQLCPTTLATDPCYTTAAKNSVYLKTSIMMNSNILLNPVGTAPQGMNYIGNDGTGFYSSYNFNCLNQGFCDLAGQNKFTIYSGQQTNYGVASFECGVSTGSSSTLGNCFNLQGSTGALYANGILAIPNIQTQFTTSTQYADSNMIDFVVSIMYGFVSAGSKPTSYTIQTQHLINGYTITSGTAPLVSFVNYYMGTTQGNNGYRLPTMVRVQANAQMVQVFFDSSIALFTEGSYGCSANCYGFPAASPGLLDIWWAQSSVISWGGTDILIPIIPKGVPYSLYVVLSNSTNNSMVVTPISVFRIFGPAVNSESRIPLVAQQTAQASNLVFPLGSFDFSTVAFTSNITNLSLTTTTSAAALQINQVSSIGAGLTLTSIGQNIFSNASFSSYFAALNCSQPFAYQTYATAAQDPNYALNRYVTFCQFNNFVNYPLYGYAQGVLNFAQNFKFGNILAYGVSGTKGQLLAAVTDSQTISRLLYTCTASPTNMLYPNSLGTQRLQFGVTTSSGIVLGSGSYSSIRLVIKFTNVQGISITTTSTACVVNLALSCVYSVITTTSTTVTATLTGTLTIQPGTLIILQLILRPTYGLAAFGANVGYVIQIQLPSRDTATGLFALFGNSYAATPLVQEQCYYPTFNLSTTALGTTMSLTNLRLQLWNQLSITYFKVDFAILSQRDFIGAAYSYIQINLGFMYDQPSILQCQVLEGGLLSYRFAQIKQVAGILQLYLAADLINPSKYAFTLVCNNSIVPTAASSTALMQAYLIDISGLTNVMTSTAIAYGSSLAALTGTQVALKKILNSNGFGAVYYFTVTNGALIMQLNYKIQVQFHSGIGQGNRRSLISCKMDQTVCYCNIIGNTVTMNVCQVIQPSGVFQLQIGQIDQPQSTVWPTAANIWIGVFSNGVLYFQSIVADIQSAMQTILPFTVNSESIASNYIRISQTHTIVASLPSQSVFGNILFVEFPPFYIDQMQFSNTISVSLIRVGDTTLQNYAASVQVLGSMLQIQTTQDPTNSQATQYTFTITGVPLPAELPGLQYYIRIHVQSGSIVQYTSTTYMSSPLALISESAQDLQWSGGLFSYSRDEVLTVIPTQSIYIYQGVYRTMLQLKPLTTTFTQTFGFKTQNLSTYPSTLTANSGAQSSNFLVGTTLQVGYYIFTFSKSDGGANYVTSLPKLHAFIVNQQCPLTTDQSTYSLPLGGLSQLIVIDVSNCFPMQDLRIKLVNPNGTQIQILSENPQNIAFTQGTGLHFPSQQYIFQLQSNDTSVAVGTTYTMYFNISGNSYQYYVAPPSVIIKIDAAVSSTVSFYQTPYAYVNNVIFYIQTTSATTIYWVIGVGDQIQYESQQSVMNQTTTSMRTYRNTSDPEWRIYGAANVNGNYIEKFEGLQQNAQYSFYVFANNQISFTWQTSPNGGSPIKLNITFNNPLSTIFQLQLICGINQMFPIDPSRIYDPRSYTCDVDTLSQIQASVANNTKRLLASATKPTSYLIYIQPDQSLATETINADIKGYQNFSSSLSSFMNLDPDTDPLFVSYDYLNPQQTILPTLTYKTPIISYSFVNINFTLAYASGWLGVAIEQTDSAPLPSIIQLRRQQNYLNSTIQGQLLFVNATSTINKTVVVNFTGLSQNLKYQLYWFNSDDDAGLNQLSSNVSFISLQTTVSEVFSSSAMLVVIYVLFCN